MGAEHIEESKINVAARDFDEIRWDDEQQSVSLMLSRCSAVMGKKHPGHFRNENVACRDDWSTFNNYKEGMLLASRL